MQFPVQLIMVVERCHKRWRTCTLLPTSLWPQTSLPFELTIVRVCPVTEQSPWDAIPLTRAHRKHLKFRCIKAISDYPTFAEQSLNRWHQLGRPPFSWIHTLKCLLQSPLKTIHRHQNQTQHMHRGLPPILSPWTVHWNASQRHEKSIVM